MGVQRGKQFEGQVRKGFEAVKHCSVDRLLDPQAGYAGIKNICDFIVYKYPNEFYIECKSHYGNTLPFSCITENQWHGLLMKSQIKGIIAGVMVWFIDHDLTVFVPIQLLDSMKKSGKKSFNIKDTVTYLDEIVIVYGLKRRILYEYNMALFIEDVCRLTTNHNVNVVCDTDKRRRNK